MGTGRGNESVTCEQAISDKRGKKRYVRIRSSCYDVLPGDRSKKTSVLAFFHKGGAHPLKQSSPPQRLLPPEIWSENNIKISITKEICKISPPPP